MAQAAGVRSALVRLGFTQPSAEYITNDQGLDTLIEFAILTDDEIQSLVKFIRRPGGTINNPAVVAAQGAGNATIAAALAAPNLIPNTGLTVSLRAENNLKLMCYFLNFRERVSTPATPPEITLAAVRAMKGQREMEDDHKDVEAPEIDSKDWPRKIDAIEEWLRGCLGVTKIPLAYVIRESIDTGVEPADGWSSKQEELIARAPIMDPVDPDTFHSTYLSDHAKV